MPSRILACLLLLIAVTGFAGPLAAGSAGTVYSVDGDGIAIGGYDPVAYQTEHEAVAGNPDITADWSGATWRFASDASRQAFLADPERYAPVFGGWCAMGMAAGQVVESDPVNAWSLYEGRLYLNVNADVGQRWRRSAGRLVPRAEGHWPEAEGTILSGNAKIVWQSDVPGWY